MILEMHGAEIAEGRMEPSAIVDMVDEAGKMFDNVGKCLELHRVDGLDLKRLHEALRLGVVVRVSSPSH